MEDFGDCNVILSLRHPHNLLGKLTRTEFTSTPNDLLNQEPTLFKYQGKICDLLRLNYIQENSSFTTSNGSIWNVRSHINGKSNSVLYYL